MIDKNPNSPDVAAQQNADVIKHPPKGKHRGLWILLLVFLVFVITVFLTAPRDTIDWIEDYDAGIEQARQQNKTILLSFYKPTAPMSISMIDNTYNNHDVIEYVEANFVPILIDVDKHPDIAKLYNINYYPTHYIKKPDSDELFGPLLGYDPPERFIEKLKRTREKMDHTDK
jgi:regulatory protein YycH of two-component signal transduction system YycFG